MATITITFGDQAENHVGMEKLGNLAESGYSAEELEKFYDKYSKTIQCELIELNDVLPKSITNAERANVLILRQGVKHLLNNQENCTNELRRQLEALSWDTKAKMYGRIVNKHARHNLCFAEYAQEPDYEAGKGRVVDFDQVPLLEQFRDRLVDFFGERVRSIVAEGNLYYDTSKCGIGYHGDAERKIVIALRLGASIPLHYHWFHQGDPVGSTMQLMLYHGDVYLMSEKATGFDWKRKKQPTLRHAAGCKKFLTLPVGSSNKKPKTTTKVAKKQKKSE